MSTNRFKLEKKKLDLKHVFSQTWCDEATNHVTMSKSAFYPSARTCSEQLKALRIFERVMLKSI